MSRTGSSGDGGRTIEERIPGGPVKLWVLLDADRWLLAVILLAGLFVLFVLAGTLDPAPLRQSVATKDPIETLFQALVTAIVTGVTLVVTINQLVLSQELGAVGDQRDRMSGAMEFQREVESMLDRSTSPRDPASFMRVIVDEIADRGEYLLDRLGTSSSGQHRDDVREFVAALRGDAERVSPRLESAEFGTYEVVGAALDYDYSVKIHEARRLRNSTGESIPEEARETLDDVTDLLELYGTAREHVKTLYFQWELINLSRAVLYAAVPALFVTVSMVLFVDDTATITGTLFGIDTLLLVVSGAVVVALAPFVIFLSFILRIATVTKRTLAIGPFVLREERSD